MEAYFSETVDTLRPSLASTHQVHMTVHESFSVSKRLKFGVHHLRPTSQSVPCHIFERYGASR